MKSSRIHINRFAKTRYINLAMLARIEGWLLMMECVFMLLPCVVAMIYETESAIPFFIAVAITGGVGLLMTLIPAQNKDMGRREAILLTGLTWVILSIFGMLPFILYGTHMSVTDAFFETMSGFTTTGATVLHTLKDVPNSILLWRCLIQWIGGLGILLFTLAVVPMLNSSGGLMVFNAEVTGITHDKLRPRVGATAKGLWGVYILLTAILIILLSFSDMDFFNALCYGLSTMSTGGFSTSDEGIALYNTVYVKIVMIVFMFLGGVNLSLLYNAMRGKAITLAKNTVFKVYLAIIGVGYVLMTIDILLQGGPYSVELLTVTPLFQTVSMISSTGIVAPGFPTWGALTVMVTLIIMFMGACAGSTSGGAKIDRFIVLFKFLKNEFYKIMHPNAVTTVSLNGKGTQPGIIYKTLAFLFLYIFIILIGGTIISLSGLPLGDSLFSALEAISNTGLGSDATGTVGDYAGVADYVKWILAFIMLIGRLEIFTVLVVLTYGFWRR